jgi:regulator of protease activity HflC (stomatin/prohibitin superfamily)
VRTDGCIGIVDVTIQQAQPPEPVQAAFEDANKAAQDRDFKLLKQWLGLA